MPAASLEISGLSAGYGPTRVLEDISFAAEAGRRLAVLGRNGMGKSTLFATLAGQTKRYGGEIRLGQRYRRLGGAGHAGQQGQPCRNQKSAFHVHSYVALDGRGRPRAEARQLPHAGRPRSPDGTPQWLRTRFRGESRQRAGSGDGGLGMGCGDGGCAGSRAQLCLRVRL